MGVGPEKALTVAISHIIYAVESDDASENVRNFDKPFAVSTEITLEPCDLILTLGEEILSTVSALEATTLAGEILNLGHTNVEGVDTDGNIVIDLDLDEYGFKQLRA